GISKNSSSGTFYIRCNDPNMGSDGSTSACSGACFNSGRWKTS
ncbi:unnamed protein product, partial [Allacma fusca]